MKVVEVKVIYESDNIDKVTKEISDIFYGFGATGLKIEEPLKVKNPLDFYKNEKDFIMVDNAVSAYFPLNIYAEKRKQTILSTFEEKFKNREDIVYTLDFYEYDEENYQDSWKKYLFPEKVSEKFVIKPTWREYTPSENELVIELDPGRAFGTGSHPTTSLCLKLMENVIKHGDSLIDIGTGSGILMIAGEKLGAKKVVGIDIDELAVEVAKENLELNGIFQDKSSVFKGDITSISTEKKFDVVVANILVDVLLIILPHLHKILKPEGKIIFSGIIEDRCEELKKAIESFGFVILEIKEDKEWRAILIKS